MVWWLVGVIVSIDTVLALTNSPSRRHSAAQPRQPSSVALHFPHQPVIPRRSGWSQELSGQPDQQLLVVCTLVASGDERAGAQTGGADVRLGGGKLDDVVALKAPVCLPPSS